MIIPLAQTVYTYSLAQFFSGAVMMGSFAAGLFFLKFWRQSRDRLFAIFAVAFWVLGIDRLALVLSGAPNEVKTWFYLIRLLAFILILIAIIDKNRARSA